MQAMGEGWKSRDGGTVRVNGPMDTLGQLEVTPVGPSVTTHSPGGLLR